MPPIPRLAVVLALAGPLCLVAPARASRLPATLTAQAVPSGTAIVLDGQFDEPVWEEAPVISEFVQREPAEGRAPSQRTEVQPYTLGQLSVAPLSAVNALVERTDPSGSGGLDLKYALTPGLTLTATANPDFGQVEVDPAVVNLDAFETFFQERRPFFVEGSGTFRFNMDCNDGECTGLFYSRRIGRAPQGVASAGPGESAAQPSAATILGAAKLTGRVGRFAVGAITAYTQEEQATMRSGCGTRTGMAGRGTSSAASNSAPWR